MAGALLTLAPSLSAQEVRQQRVPTGTVALIVLQATVITGLLVHARRRRRAERDHQRVSEANHRQITELCGRLIAAQEGERSRIARDLDDDVSQRIAALSISISSLKRKLLGGAADESTVVAMTAIQRDTAALAEEVRHVSYNLYPSLLQHTGLLPALSGFCTQFGNQRGITVTCCAVADLGPIDADTALCLYRVTQEALYNVAKHAQARRVDVRVTRTANGVQLSIADDGKGFDLTNTRERANGVGLVSIDQRVRTLGGTVHIETRPGGGTLIVVRLPSSDGTRRVNGTALPVQA